MTRKEYEQVLEQKREVAQKLDNARFLKDWPQAATLNEQYTKLQEQIDAQPTVCVSFLIGSRKYYRKAHQFGRTFYANGRKINKANGCHGLEIIPEITDKMNKEMLSDAYHY